MTKRRQVGPAYGPSRPEGIKTRRAPLSCPPRSGREGAFMSLDSPRARHRRGVRACRMEPVVQAGGRWRGVRLVVRRGRHGALPARSRRGARGRPRPAGLDGGRADGRQRGAARPVLRAAAARLRRRRPVLWSIRWPAAPGRCCRRRAAIAFLGERPARWSVAGAALIVAAVFSLIRRSDEQGRRAAAEATVFALLTGAAIAATAVGRARRRHGRPCRRWSLLGHRPRQRSPALADRLPRPGRPAAGVDVRAPAGGRRRSC